MTRLVTDWKGKQVMTKDEALKMAIQEIEYLYNQTAIDRIGNVLNACKEALEQPQPRLFLDLSNSNGNHPVEQPAWQGLTDKEKNT